MPDLMITMVDVGHGDCILLEANDAAGRHFALVDCPDSKHEAPGFVFLKRALQRAAGGRITNGRAFEFVLMTHGDKDHCQGLHRILRVFGTEHFCYGPSLHLTTITAHVLAYARRARVRVGAVDLVHSGTPFPVPLLGRAAIRVLHPTRAGGSNANNSSVVLEIEIDGVSILLTGDIEAGTWAGIALPPKIDAVKVPHHGAENAVYENSMVKWPVSLSAATLAISCHCVPFDHPDAQTVSHLATTGGPIYRTDRQGNISFIVDHGNLTVRCWQ